MSLLDNPAVRKAYEDRTYTDATGVVWHRGLDGWFDQSGEELGIIHLIRHDDFVEMVIQESLEGPPP